jgi:dihydroneopterin aldolase
MTDWFFDSRLAGCRRIFIRDFDVSAAIGVFPQEQGRTQQVRMNIDFWVPQQDTPSDRDKLEDVVDYDFIRPGIHHLISQGHIGLLETLVDRTAQQVLAHPLVLAVRVRAEKSEVYPDCKSAGVECFRFRDATTSFKPYALMKDPSRAPVKVQNIFCIGRNYAAHIAELGNRPSGQPVVFTKPTSAIRQAGEPIVLPAHSSDVHFETELVLLIGKGGRNIARSDALQHVSAVTVGLDLTARDLQTHAKQNGLPWDTGKGFDGAACLSPFVTFDASMPISAFEFTLQINGAQRQHGKISNMLYPVDELIAYLSSIFTLQPGDLIYTGTPEGVGPLKSGDQLQLSLNGQLMSDYAVA